MNSRERMESCISGERLDRPPVSLWRHFPVDDRSADSLARSIVLFQNIYQFDFVKITPSSSYSVRDWGSKDEWKGNPEGSCDYTQYAITDPEDWIKIRLLDPTIGSLGEQLECIRLVRKSLPVTTPIVQTIFSPLAQAKNLVGKQNLLVHLHAYPDAVKTALRTITEQTLLFIRECKKLNVDGIFFAVQHAQKNLLTEDEFKDFCMCYDLQVLSETRDLWLNIGHIHGTQIMFDLLSQYPVQVLNWHDREEMISLREGKENFSGAVCGGLRQWETMAYGNPTQVSVEAMDAIQQTMGRRFILGTGCVLPIIAPHSNILAAIQAVHQVNKWDN